MTEQPYAVFNASRTVATFSTEGLAQTHAAKLRALPPERGSKSGIYTVAPLVLDELVGLEIEYFASFEAVLSELANWREADIERGISEYLTRELTPDITERYVTVSPKSDHEVEHIAFDAFGWDPEQALAKLRAMIAAELTKLTPGGK